MTAIISLLIIVLSLFFKKIKFLLPVSTIVLSIILFVTSLLIGEWEGIGLGLFSLSLFLASPIAFIVISCISRYQWK